MIPHANNCLFSGRLTKDPETRYVNDKPVTNANFVCNERTKKNGEYVDAPIWLTLEAWGFASEVLASMQKGNALQVSGRLVPESYTTREGETKSSLRLVLTTCVGIKEYKRDDESSDYKPASRASDSFNVSITPLDDDVPF